MPEIVDEKFEVYFEDVSPTLLTKGLFQPNVDSAIDSKGAEPIYVRLVHTVQKYLLKSRDVTEPTLDDVRVYMGADGAKVHVYFQYPGRDATSAFRWVGIRAIEGNEENLNKIYQSIIDATDDIVGVAETRIDPTRTRQLSNVEIHLEDKIHDSELAKIVQRLMETNVEVSPLELRYSNVTLKDIQRLTPDAQGRITNIVDQEQLDAKTGLSVDKEYLHYQLVDGKLVPISG